MILPVLVVLAGGFLKKQPADRAPCGCVARREQGIELEYEVELWRSNPEPPTEKEEQ